MRTATGASSILPQDFYIRDTIHVARSLLGRCLVRVVNRARMAGRIVEVEAYRGSHDPASHAFRGLTKRNVPMFAEPGRAYIYFTYGNHYCLNVTTEPEGIPGAVLIRALEPTQGVEFMRRLRPHVPDLQLTNGPGKLTKALDIDRTLNTADMTKAGPLFITSADPQNFEIGQSARVGIRQGRDRKWRFYIVGNPYVSKVNV